MFSKEMTMRVMANKYRRLAEQQTKRKERDKYGAYSRIYFELALHLQRTMRATNYARTSRQ
jgi:hypothetical protein